MVNPTDHRPSLTLLQVRTPQALRASGADIDGFLQGQLTGDLRQLTPDHALWSAYCNPKGRMLAAPLLLRNGADVELWLPPAMLEPVQKRLRLFVLRAKVQFEVPAHPPVSLAVVGSEAESWIAAQGWLVPRQHLQVTIATDLRVVRLPGVTPRFLAIGPAAQRVAVAQERLIHGLIRGEAAALAWREADIRAGIPRVAVDTQDRWVPQMANLDLLGGISFDKGCYTGQEIVARLHYLGNLKKRMFLVQGSGDAPLPGSVIRDGAGQSAGEIVDACAVAAGGFVASAILQMSVADSGTLRLEREVDAGLAQPQAYGYAEGESAPIP